MTTQVNAAGGGTGLPEKPKPIFWYLKLYAHDTDLGWSFEPLINRELRMTVEQAETLATAVNDLVAADGEVK